MGQKLANASGVNHRHRERLPLPCGIVLQSPGLGFADSAILRDISSDGGYCYTILPVARGEVVELFLALADGIDDLHLSFTGTVVRVENGVTDNSLGIAIAFSGVRELNGECT